MVSLESMAKCAQYTLVKSKMHLPWAMLAPASARINNAAAYLYNNALLS